MKTQNIYRISSLAVVAAVVLILASCGGSGSGMSAPAGAAPVMMTGTVVRDNGVTVDGVAFDAGSALITADNIARGPGFLDSGMTVKLRGRINDDRVTGVADMIKVLAEVRGGITSV